jgi:hypothetical protein
MSPPECQDLPHNDTSVLSAHQNIRISHSRQFVTFTFLTKHYKLFYLKNIICDFSDHIAWRLTAQTSSVFPLVESQSARVSAHFPEVNVRRLKGCWNLLLMARRHTPHLKRHYSIYVEFLLAILMTLRR